MPAKTRVMISSEQFGRVNNRSLNLLKDFGLELVRNPTGRLLKEAEMMELIRGCDASISGAEPMSAAVIDSSPNLRFISRCSVGLDSCDLLHARERGIPVSYVPGANAQAVTELTITHILALLRGVRQADISLRGGTWIRVMGRSIKELTVGIIGVGRIGKRVARHLTQFGAKIIANDLEPDEAFGADVGIEWVEKEQIFREADVVCLHVPKTPLTIHMVGAEQLAMMKCDSLLVNTARGGLIDETALAEALRTKRIGGAGIDVYENEPYEGELTRLDNCLLTCHMAANTKSSRLRMEIEAAENLLCFLKGEPVPGLVPEYEYELQAMTAGKR